MQIKTVLSVIATKDVDADVEEAIAFCRENQLHLSLLVVALAAPPPIGEYAAVVSDEWFKEREADRRNLLKRTERVREIVGASAIPARVESVYTELAWLADEVSERAFYADLTLLGPRLLARQALKNGVLNGALFGSGVPALLIPADCRASLAPKCALVAWDNSQEASRAIRAALDILAGADEVHITMVDPQPARLQGEQEPGSEMAAYLAQHGVKVILDRLPDMGRPVAETLGEHATDIAADMIVMGAYSHARWRERMFGGVSKSMIDSPPMTLFMAR